MVVGKRIIEIAIENGASLAGLASMEALKVSASHTLYKKVVNDTGMKMVKDVDGLPDNEFIDDDEALKGKPIFSWPDTVKTVLVIGLSHPEENPDLDWWDGRGTLGNRILISTIKRTSQEIENSLKVKTRKLHYYVERGGIFLKDAAVLAGLGCIGKNNMLITPSYGPRVRLRALFLDAKIRPTGPIDFDPCSDCKVYCRKVCPEKAMNAKALLFKSFEFTQPLPGRDGTYNRELCNKKMEKDVAESTKNNSGKQPTIKFCRKCEFICPVGKIPQNNHRILDA
jgi:epoxyqueuosine reductase